MMRRLLCALVALILMTGLARAQGAPAQAAAVGYNTLVFGPNLVLCKTPNPVTSYPEVGTGCGNIAPFSFFGWSWLSIGIVQNADGSISLDGTGESFGNGGTLGATGLFRQSPLSFGGQSFGGGFYAEVTMKGTGPMSWWANDVETMNGAGQGWGTTPFPGQQQNFTLTSSSTVTAGDGVSIYAYAPWFNGGNILQLPTFTVSGTTPTLLMAQAAAQINASSQLSGAGVSATGSGATLLINTTTNGQTPAIRFNIAAVSGAFSETFNYSNFADDIETDIAEFDFTNAYGFTVHNWNGYANADAGGILANNGYVAQPNGSGGWNPPAGVDFTQYNKYGLLWVPATSTSSGYMQAYFNGNKVNNTLFYNLYNANLPPPIATGSITNLQPGSYGDQIGQVTPSAAWSVVDTRHLMFIFGGSTGNTTTFGSMSVWQNAAGMAADLPPISGSGPPPPPTNFHVSNGQIINPNGQVFVPSGINIYLEQLGNLVTNSAAQPLTTLFPKINQVRLVIETGTPFADYPTPASMAPLINELTANGIVVVIDDHSCNGGELEESGGAVAGPPWCSPPTSGAALTTVTNWYTALAQEFSTNPYVWFASVNEPCTDAATCSYANESIIGTYQVAIYNAVRVAGGAGNMMEMLSGVGGGNCGTVGTNSSMVPSDYSSMTNIVWELHSYSSPSVAALQGSVATACGYVAAQSISSADGLVPVIFGEWGSASGNNTGSDAGPYIAAMQSVLQTKNGDIGSSAFTAYGYAPTWEMVTPPPTSPGTFSLTGWGQDIANMIAVTAQPGGSTSGPVAVPAPLTGTVTTQTWIPYDQTFAGVTLACGKPFHFIVLPPAQYNGSAYKYPLLIWEHPDFQGDPWYLGTNTNTAYLSSDEAGSFNAVPILTNYPGFIAVPYADQTNGNGSTGSCTADANDAVENWGGWFNNGSTGSGTVYSGDTGPNVFAVLDMINYLETQYSIDTSRILIEGFSLGGIGSEYMMQKYNSLNGSPAVFASGASMAGVLQINGFGAGPNTTQETAMTNVPVWWFSGANDTSSVPAQWNNPMFTALSGGSSAFPTAITSVAANKAGNSKMEYTLCPTCGHQDTDASGNPVWVNTTILNFLFGANASSGGGGGSGTTTWDPTRVPANMALSNGNLTASATAAVARSDNVVWSTTSYSTGKYCFAVVGNTMSTNWAMGLANSSYPSVPTSAAGLGGDSFGEGFYPVSPTQAIYYAAVQLSVGATADISGDEVDECVDLGTDLVWVQTPVMRAAGQTWNNSTTASPATETGGISISGLTCPCFIVFNTEDDPSVATLNAGGPFESGLPSGFSVWTPPAAASHSPLLINLGANDNHPPAANDNGWDTLYSPASYQRSR